MNARVMAALLLVGSLLLALFLTGEFGQALGDLRQQWEMEQ